MIIDVLSIKEGERSNFNEEIDVKRLDVEYVDLHYINRVVLDITVEKIMNSLTLDGTLKRRVEHICARCLKTVQEELQERIHLVFDVKGQDQLDLTPDIRDALILSHPDRFLCSPNCKGLCPKCGIDLNIESCGCETDASAKNPFSSLKKLWKDKHQ